MNSCNYRASIRAPAGRAAFQQRPFSPSSCQVQPLPQASWQMVVHMIAYILQLIKQLFVASNSVPCGPPKTVVVVGGGFAGLVRNQSARMHRLCKSSRSRTDNIAAFEPREERVGSYCGLQRLLGVHPRNSPRIRPRCVRSAPTSFAGSSSDSLPLQVSPGTSYKY